MTQQEMFPSNRLPECSPYLQTRNMRDPLMSDRSFAPEVLRAVYEAGPEGLPMKTLIAMGIERGWWQDTVDKHFGEKMRCAWAYGFLVVPEVPGDQRPDRKLIVHPDYFDPRFKSPRIERLWTSLCKILKQVNFCKVR